MKKSKKFKKGDVVHTDTHAVYQNTQKSLSRRKGIVVDNSDDMNIHVLIEGFSQPIGFSEFELSHTKPNVYKNEEL